MNDIPDWAKQKIQQARKQRLTELDLSRKWNAPDSEKLTHLPDEVLELTWLQSLDVRGNQLTALPDWLAQLTNLQSLDVRGNQLTALPGWLARLTNLQVLAVSDNQLAALPDWLARLTNLQSLDVSYNQLTALPDWLAHLTNLQVLNVSFNRLTALPDWLAHLTNLQELYVSDNPLEIPPLEALDLNKLGGANLEKLRDYFRQQREAGIDHLYEAKLIIIGEPGAGKTTLANKIINPDYQLREEDTTKGIQVMQWQFPLPASYSLLPTPQSFRVNIWDFGGQEIYHATHQFFLTKRSLYALVADSRKEDTDFYYWLSISELLSDGSPLLLIKNEKQDRKREINERQLRGQFDNLKESLAANLADNRGLAEILDCIRHYITHLPHVGAALPKTWVRVRQALEQDPRNYIGLQEYLDICERNGFKRLEDKLQLADYLHDLGVCLHFQDDPLLNKTVILKPQWGTAAVYKALDNERVIQNQGRFTRADLPHIWREEQYAGMHDELAALMLKFKLCYELPMSDAPGKCVAQQTFIAPQLLSPNQPDYAWDAADNLYMRYTYEFMPKGIITRLIVELHRLIADQRWVWRSGVVLEKDQTRAEVIEHYGKREMQIRAAGKHKRELLTIVAYELDKIHDSYNRLKYSKWIPCNCAGCKAVPEPYFFKFELLQRALELRQDKVQCGNTFEMVGVLGLIDDVGIKSQASGRNLVSENRLRQLLVKHFSDSELRDLSAELGIDYESLGGSGKAANARELVAHLERRGRLDKLIEAGRRLRPDVGWGEAID